MEVRAVSAELHTPALVLDPDGRVQAANPLAERLLGRSYGELEGTRVGEVLAGRRPDGTPVRIRTNRRPREDGTTLCLLEEVGAEALVATLLPRLDVAFDHAPIGMGIIDSDGRFIRVNDALCALLGRPRRGLIDRRDSDLTHPDDRDRDIELAAKILAGELDSAQHEKRFVRPDGQVVWVVSNVTYVRDADGIGIAWVGQWQDITARRAAEDALRRERDLSAATLGAMHEGFCLTRDGEVLQVNDALCRLTGFERDALIGTRMPFPWTPPEELAHADDIRARFVGLGRGEADVVCMRRDGTRFEANVSAAAVRGPDGALLGWVHTMRDVSERNRHAAELAQLATHDALTGLLNHRAAHERLRGEAARAERSGQPLSLAIIDLDHFKAINDQHGHPVGDAVLNEVGRRFRALTRAGEHMARMGGEEFAWVLPGATGPQAFAAAERARRAIESEPFPGVGTLTASVGVCELADAGSPDELHRLADVALYWAKAQGRNLVFRWTASTAQELDAAGTIVHSPRRAARLEALRAVARAVDEDRPAGPGHAERVGDLAARLAAALGWTAARIALLREAAELHDVGKVALAPTLLRKPGGFDEAEWAQVRAHPGLGADMLDGVLDEEQRAWVRGHHERWDGRGYPDGLGGTAIPMGARLLACADAYDAMTSERPYSPARSLVDAVFEVREGAGRQFDPDVAAALVALLTTAPAAV